MDLDGKGGREGLGGEGGEIVVRDKVSRGFCLLALHEDEGSHTHT